MLDATLWTIRFTTDGQNFLVAKSDIASNTFKDILKLNGDQFSQWIQSCAWGRPRHPSRPFAYDKASELSDKDDWTLPCREKIRKEDIPAIDGDMVVFRESQGAIEPAAWCEVTRCDHDGLMTPTYRDNMMDRFCGRDGQSKMAVAMARRLGVEAWIVIFNLTCTKFQVFNLTRYEQSRDNPDTASYVWWGLDAAKHRKFIEFLGEHSEMSNTDLYCRMQAIAAGFTPEQIRSSP
jgi:hypothetical protein